MSQKQIVEIQGNKLKNVMIKINSLSEKTLTLLKEYETKEVNKFLAINDFCSKLYEIKENFRIYNENVLLNSQKIVLMSDNFISYIDSVENFIEEVNKEGIIKFLDSAHVFPNFSGDLVRFEEKIVDNTKLSDEADRSDKNTFEGKIENVVEKEEISEHLSSSIILDDYIPKNDSQSSISDELLQQKTEKDINKTQKQKNKSAKKKNITIEF